MSPKIFWLTIFGIAMAFVESAVVVYLRAIFYPEGFKVPLRTITDYKIIIEVFREIATIFMLLSVAFLSGKTRWERFTYFMLSFGIWDIFYYIWLKALINWPASIFDWDILFLIPLPWISPVIAPVSVSLLMIIFSILIAHSIQKGYDFKPALLPRILALVGIVLILYSFMHDINATLHQQIPKPYRYELLVIGDGLFIAAFWVSYLRSRRG
ncbi:MAG: hypothetical protein HZB30_13175 [Nitrospirae bacterium]|nr:hypothetical protein [Nitrospirota bacterium]